MRALEAAISAATSGAEIGANDVNLLIEAVSTPSNAHFAQKVGAVQAIARIPLSRSARASVADTLGRQAVPGAFTLDEEGRAGRSGWGPALSAVLADLLLGLLVFWVELSRNEPPPLWLVLAMLVPVVALPVTGLRLVGERRRFVRMRAEATRAMGALKESGTIQILLQNIRDPDTRIRSAARDCLPAVLDAIVAEEAPLLPDAALELCRLLGDRSEALVVSILDVLKLYGGGASAHPVERLVTRGRTEAIRANAARVLPVLQERLKQEQDPKTLVRPASAPEDATEELLRPAAPQRDTDTDTLLRLTEEYESQAVNIDTNS